MTFMSPFKAKIDLQRDKNYLIFEISHIVSCIKSTYKLAPKLVWQNDGRMSDEVSERRLDMAAGADQNSARTEKLNWGKAALRATKKGESEREWGKLNSGPALSVPFCSHSALYILRKVRGYDWAMDRPHILFNLCNGGNQTLLLHFRRTHWEVTPHRS